MLVKVRPAFVAHLDHAKQIQSSLIEAGDDNGRLGCRIRRSTSAGDPDLFLHLTGCLRIRIRQREAGDWVLRLIVMAERVSVESHYEKQLPKYLYPRSYPRPALDPQMFRITKQGKTAR